MQIPKNFKTAFMSFFNLVFSAATGILFGLVVGSGIEMGTSAFALFIGLVTAIIVGVIQFYKGYNIHESLIIFLSGMIGAATAMYLVADYPRLFTF